MNSIHIINIKQIEGIAVIKNIYHKKSNPIEKNYDRNKNQTKAPIKRIKRQITKNIITLINIKNIFLQLCNINRQINKYIKREQRTKQNKILKKIYILFFSNDLKEYIYT